MAYSLKTLMELFIIHAQGMCPKIVIWLMERQDSLRSRGVTPIASLVGDVLEKREHKVELVQRPSPCPRASWCTTTEKRKPRQIGTTGRYSLNKSSLLSLEFSDLANSSQGLAKLQHKLQQMMQREDTKVKNGCTGTE